MNYHLLQISDFFLVHCAFNWHTLQFFSIPQEHSPSPHPQSQPPLVSKNIRLILQAIAANKMIATNIVCTVELIISYQLFFGGVEKNPTLKKGSNLINEE